MRKVVGTIDLTPTWSGVLPIYLAVLQNPNAQASSRNGAMAELERMAELADMFVAQSKGSKTDA